MIFDPENPEFLSWEHSNDEEVPLEKTVCRWCGLVPDDDFCHGMGNGEHPHVPVVMKSLVCECGDMNIVRVSSVSGWESHAVNDEGVWDPDKKRFTVVGIGDFIESETTDVTDVHYECSRGHLMEALGGVDEEW